MATSKPLHNDELARLERKLNRERRAREEAERLLEEKSSQLFDANQRLEAEAKRARSLVTAIQSASDGIALTDADGLFVFMNKAHAAMFGYEVDELIGQSWSILYSTKELKRFDKQIMPDFGRYGFWSGETTGQAKTGDYVLQDIALTALPDGGLICATRDITKRRANLIRARELEQRLQKAEQEAALFTVGNAVAHDFNNLIGAISGYAVLIQRNLDEASEPFKYAERISQAADQAAGVIRSLELERTNDTNTLDEVDLASLVQTGVSIAEAIRPPGITMDVDIPTSAMVQANEVTLSRCLLNISKNAFEAMGEEGELLIRVTDSPTDPFDEQTAYVSLGESSANYEWIIEICDTGTGIRQEKLDKIFEPFFTTKSTFKGSGLGLLSLTALVESGTAFIEVMSRLDYGTQFRLSFKPESVEKNATLNSEPDMMPASSHEGQKPHVLVVEDEAMMGEVIASTLKNLGYSCDLRHDPRKALALLEDDAYRVDLVLTDLTMPHIRGDDFSDRVKILRADLPVIIYSGQAGYIKSDPKYAAILRKPIAAHDLDDAIQSALRG